MLFGGGEPHMDGRKKLSQRLRALFEFDCKVNVKCGGGDQIIISHLTLENPLNHLPCKIVF